MAIWQLPSGVWYDDSTNQVVSGPSNTPQPTTQPSTGMITSNPYHVQNSWNLTGGVWNGNSWSIQPTLTIDGRTYTFPNPQGLYSALQQMQASGATNIAGTMSYWQGVSQQTPTTQPAAPQPAPVTQPPSNSAAIPMSGGYIAGSPQTQTTQQAPIDPNTGQQPGVQSDIMASDSGTNPYFMGNFALIQVSGYPGTYLVDKGTKTIRAFSSDQALVNAIPNVSSRHIVTVPASYVSPGGMFSADTGYQMLDAKYAIEEDGKFLSLDASSAQLQSRYGQAIDQNSEQDAYLLLDGMMSSVRDNPNGGLPSTFIDTLKTDKSALAFMISAIAYGGYTPGDVYSDMKRRYLISQGDTSLQNVSPISATQNRDTYQATDAGKQALSNPKLTPPEQIGTLDPSVMKLPLFQIPQEAFNTLIPIMNPDTQEYKDAVSKIQDAYHDVLLQQLSATTEQQKAIADSNWQMFRNNVQSQLGVTLSNNALDAWTQIQTAQGSFAQQGISGSGLESESIDDYLKRVRSQANQSRTYYQSQTDAQEALYYQKYATPQQVKDLIASDPAKAQSWGLVPSTDIKSALSFDTLKAKYPNLSDQEINDYIASTLDENGNYRSALYQTYMTSKLQTQQDEQTYKEGQVANNSLLDEAKAYREFTTPDVPFLRDVTDPTKVGVGMAAPTINDITGGSILGTPGQYSNIQSVLGGAYANGSPTTPVQQASPTYTQPQSPAGAVQPPSTPSSYPKTAVIAAQSAQPGSTTYNTTNISNPMQGIDTSFIIPALKPSTSPFAGSTSPTIQTPIKSPVMSIPSKPPVMNNMTTTSKTTTPSTVGTASASKTLSALQQGLNGIKNFGSNVAGGFMSLFGY